MTGAPAIPEKVRRIVPTLGSSVDGEALGACRAIGRTLGAAGLDYHDLARAIPVQSEIPVPCRAPPAWDSARWRTASTKPAPEYRPSRRKPSTFTPKQNDAFRRMALHCRNADRGRLSPRERDFIANVSSWRRELTIGQADWLTGICDRLEQEDRCL